MHRDNVCPNCGLHEFVKNDTGPYDQTIIQPALQYKCLHCGANWVRNFERDHISILASGDADKSKKITRQSKHIKKTTTRSVTHKTQSVNISPKTADGAGNSIKQFDSNKRGINRKKSSTHPSRSALHKISKFLGCTIEEARTICRAVQKISAKPPSYSTIAQAIGRLESVESRDLNKIAQLAQKLHKAELKERASSAETSQNEEEYYPLDSSVSEEDIYQYDRFFGSKYVGQSRRDWDGTYGSIPLYDPYDDESTPDFE